MDPNASGPTNPGATPPPPPEWGQTPPPPPPPAWGVPVAPAGGVAAAAGGIGKNVLLRIIGIVVLAAVVGGGWFIYDKVANPNHHGQVIFTTDVPTGSTCELSHQVTTVKVGASVYSTYFWTHRLKADQKVVEEDFKDGVSLGTFDIPQDKSSDADCLGIYTDLKDEFTAPGVYEIKLMVGTEVVADGKITVTQ
jgi:hypothetical protein